MTKEMREALRAQTLTLNPAAGQGGSHLRLNLGAPVELTIASGVITITGGSNYTVDTQGDAASDDLDTINGGVAWDLLILRAANSARTVVVKDGTGNIHLAGDFSLDNADDVLELLFDGTNWLQKGRNDNSV